MAQTFRPPPNPGPVPPVLRPSGCCWWVVICLCLCAPANAGRPKVGLALSGGGAKGLAHIGILQVLEDMGVKIDYIAGTSMGSIIGGLYAAGYSPKQMLEMVRHVDWMDAFSSTPQRRLLRYDQKDRESRYLFEVGLSEGKIMLPTGLITDYKLLALLNRYCLPVADIRDFSKLRIPYRAVATDLATGRKVTLTHGNLAQAMRASMSIPTIFPPFELNGRLLVDGGLVENLPVETVKAMGADVVIAVNVGSPLRKKDQLDNFLAVLDQITTFQIAESTRRQAKLADLLITPKLGGYGTASFDHPVEIYKIGLKAGQEAQDRVYALLKKHGVPTQHAKRPALPEVNELRVGRVSFDAPKILSLELKRVVGFKRGHKVAVSDLDAAVQKIYALGIFDSVYYLVNERADGASDIRFILKGKGTDEIRARVGFALNTSTNRSPDYSFMFNVVYPSLLAELGLAELDVNLGKDYGVRASWRIPTKSYFILPEIFYNSDIYEVYQDKDIKAEFIVDSIGASLDAGWYFGSAGKASIGYLMEWVRVRPRIGTGPLENDRDRLAGIRLRLGVDTLDQYPYSRSGLRTYFNAQTMQKHLGSDHTYYKAYWHGRMAMPLTKRQTLIPNFTLASAFNTDPPNSQVEEFGGFPDFWGYSWEEFLGHEILRVQLLHHFRLTDRFILMTAVNAGRSWDDWSDARDHLTHLYWGGGVGLGYATPLGPLNLVLGIGENGRYAVYLSFGYAH